LLSHRLRVAAPVEGFVGFPIGHSIWEDTIAAHRRELDNASPVTVIAWNTCATPTSTATSDPSWQAASTDHGLIALARTGMRRPGRSTRSRRRQIRG
jgi:hypothetical protein